MASKQVLDVESLRDARRLFTRARICAAAREVFSTEGFATATLEQIAQAAGTRRSTLYNHFRDKNEILGAIAEDYGTAMVELIGRLRGPVPSRAEIDAWIEQVSEFCLRHRTPMVLLMHMGNLIEVPAPIDALGVRLIKSLAVRLPAFGQALIPGPEQGLALARGLMVLQHLSWACAQQVRRENSPLARDMLTVAAEQFERFAQEGKGVLPSSSRAV